MTSFYDWYADLPVASPQVFGDQTDVPESGDWWDASYLMMWGSNVPITRTPDAHWMAEARYRGTKVVVVSPDYADNTKFADEWMRCARRYRRGAGHGDGPRHPLGMLCATSRSRSSSTIPPLHRPAVPDQAGRRGDTLVPGKFFTAADLGEEVENAAFKPALLDEATDTVVMPHGSLGFRLRRRRCRQVEPRSR